MKSKPLISILVPVYNSAAYIDRCMQSILRQTYKNIEVILVDDESTDNSPSICRKYASLANVEFYTINHIGVSGQRQKLLSLAKGEYWMFVDSDDYVDPQIVEALYNLSCKYNADIVQCGFRRTISDELNSVNISTSASRIYSKNEAIDALQCGNEKLRCMMWAKLYRKHVFDSIIFPLGKIHEDEAVMHRIIGNSEKVVCIEDPLYYYYRNTNSIMNRKFSYDRYDALDAIKDRMNFCKDNGLFFSADMCCLRYCLHCIELYRRTLVEMSKHDVHLQELHKKYIKMVMRAIEIPCIDEQLKSKLEVWINNPLYEDIPDYWDLSANLFQRHKEERLS